MRVCAARADCPRNIWMLINLSMWKAVRVLPFNGWVEQEVLTSLTPLLFLSLTGDPFGRPEYPQQKAARELTQIQRGSWLLNLYSTDEHTYTQTYTHTHIK